MNSISKPTVLFIIDSLQIGGSEKSLLEICKRLEKVKPIVCTIYKNDDLLSDFQKSGIEVHQLNQNKTYGFVTAIKWLSRKVRELKADLMVASLLRSELVSRMVSKATGVPLIGMIVNEPYAKTALDQHSKSVRFKVLFFMMLNRWTARIPKLFISNSESIVASNQQKLRIEPDRIKVIYRGRDSRLYGRIKPVFQNERIEFLAVGRLVAQKNYYVLIQALAKFKSSAEINFHLTIAGDGAQRDKIIDEISQHNLENEVTLLGSVSNIPELMGKSDLFIFPSAYEGFSGTLVEAMLSELPILCSDIPMNLEAIEEGESAKTFISNNVDDLVEKLINVSNHKDVCISMAQKARNVALEKFTWEEIVPKHEELYLKLIKTN